MAGSDHRAAEAPGNHPGRRPEAVKILIAGGFGVSKTTIVPAQSGEIARCTENPLSAPGTGRRRPRRHRESGHDRGLDFGRIGIGREPVLYLLGTPGQQRFWFMWNDLAISALGAVVLIDVRRPESSFAAMSTSSSSGGALRSSSASTASTDGIRTRPRKGRPCKLPEHVQVLLCDARDGPPARTSSSP